MSHESFTLDSPLVHEEKLPGWLSLPPPQAMVAGEDTKGIFIGQGSPYSNCFQGIKSGCPVSLFAHWLEGQPELLRLIRQKMPGAALRQAAFSEHGVIYRDIAQGEWDHLIPDEPVFVFGSNLAGRHGKGAAADARDQYGAKYGCGEGLTGHAYALPTKDHNLRALSLSLVQENIDRFMRFASENPEMSFRLTAVGTGLSQLDDDQVRDHVLKQAPTNVMLPGRWEAYRSPSVARVIIAGSREFNDYDLMCSKLDVILSRLDDIEIVSGGARGADLLGERYAMERSLRIRRIPALWDAFRLKAGPIRNRRMAWYATHLVAFWDGASSGTKSMIEIAKDARLQSRTILF